MSTRIYGGVELTNIDTVWTGELKATHPHGFIEYYADAGSVDPSLAGTGWFAGLLLSAVPLVVTADSKVQAADGSGFSYYTFVITSSAELAEMYTGYGMPLVVGEWTNWGESTLTSISVSSVLWANFDMLYTDGTVYLAATDPVDPNATEEETDTPTETPSTGGIKISGQIKTRTKLSARVTAGAKLRGQANIVPSVPSEPDEPDEPDDPGGGGTSSGSGIIYASGIGIAQAIVTGDPIVAIYESEEDV